MDREGGIKPRAIYRFERYGQQLRATALVVPLPVRRDSRRERDAAIRAAYPAKSQKELAADYGLTQQSISLILRKKTRRRRR